MYFRVVPKTWILIGKLRNTQVHTTALRESSASIDYLTYWNYQNYKKKTQKTSNSYFRIRYCTLLCLFYLRMLAPEIIVLSITQKPLEYKGGDLRCSLIFICDPCHVSFFLNYRTPNRNDNFPEMFPKIWHRFLKMKSNKYLLLKLLFSNDFNTVWNWTHVVTMKGKSKSKIKKS